jgi:hypothetical protein
VFSLQHSPKQILTVTAVATALAATGVASAADAPVVSKQSWTAGAALADFPGTGISKGEWIGSRAVMVHRTVTLERRQSVRLTLRARPGQKLRALGGNEDAKLSVVALTDDYVGKRHVTVRVRVSPKAVNKGEVTERVYALSR